mgnify:CR=1 FL=1|jgi:hypothetical protein|tara:strand:+ start:143 stop:379 length:237 start_codon:yes stop_codon:yes gene_type:complete
MEKLTTDELSKVQGYVSEFNTLKMKIGDTTLAQSALVLNVDSLKEEYNKYELSLMDKYGADAVVNVQSGEITRTEKTK